MNIDINNLPADIILRKSRMKDESLDDIFRVHRSRLTELADRHNLRYTIVEDIVSGADSIRADQIFGQVMAKSESGQSRVWVCMDVDRLARPDPEDAGKIIKCIQRNRVFILTPDHIYRPDNPDDMMFLKTKLWLADMELTMYKKRVKVTRSHITRKESRYSNGAAPFGYIWNKQTKDYEIDPVTYPIVEYAWELVWSHGASAAWRLVKQRFGDHVSAKSFYDIFKNPFYAGYPCNRHQLGKHTRNLDSSWIWPEKEASYPHPITLDEWHEIQQLMYDRTLMKSKTTADTWARGVIWFAECGTRGIGTGKIYRCYEYADLEAENVTCHSIYKSKLHRTLEALIEHALADPVVMKSMISDCQAAMEEREGSRSDLMRRMTSIQTAINQKDEQLKKMSDIFTMDLSPDSMRVFEQQIKSWEKDRETLNEQYAAIKMKLSVPNITPELIFNLQKLAADFRINWDMLPIAGKKAICELVFKKVTIKRNGEKGQSSITGIEYTDWFTPVPVPHQTLQSPMGNEAIRYALKCQREGRMITKNDLQSFVGSSDFRSKTLLYAIRRWLNVM